MQFHHNGYELGNPEVKNKPASTNSNETLPDYVDVLVVGSGPAGVLLAAQLARIPGISTALVERRKGPLQLGQADGISVRSIETFQAFGFAHRLINEAYWVNQLSFWAPDEDNRSKVVRTGIHQDTADDLSEFPHVILNQARVQDYFLEAATNAVNPLVPHYGLEVQAIELPSDRSEPVAVSMVDLVSGGRKTIKARYVVGCDGARSAVRESTGRKLIGDFANHMWGVMDMLPVTDFPDIRFKATIQSNDGGTILLIPREGGYLVRLYVDLGEIGPGADHDEARKAVTPEFLVEKARSVMHPYSLEAKEVAWFSVYEVGQRVADKFDDVDLKNLGDKAEPRVFIAGDACHTHSAKAGQGMNVSMQDTFNLAWKLVAVLQGRSNSSLLHTYNIERHAIAEDLIAFDRERSQLMSAGAYDPTRPERGGVTPAQMKDNYVRGGLYTAGLATKYPEGPLTGNLDHQHLATGFEVGTRFHSAEVTRVSDAKRMQLGHVHEADGRWRIYAFGDVARDNNVAPNLYTFLDWWQNNEASPQKLFTAQGFDFDSVFDLRAIFHQDFNQIFVDQLHPSLLPSKGQYALTDYEKAFACDVKHQVNIFAKRGISQGGALVVVRPDQHISLVLPLTAREELTEFFGSFMLPTAATLLN